MFTWLMNLFSNIFGNTASVENRKDGNWIGPDGVESGPNVSENWYLT